MSISNISNSIPFLDLVTPHVELEQELIEVFLKTLRTARFIGGPMVEEFEKAFAAFCDANYSVAVSSGTDALRFALMASGVRPSSRSCRCFSVNGICAAGQMGSSVQIAPSERGRSSSRRPPTIVIVLRSS